METKDFPEWYKSKFSPTPKKKEKNRKRSEIMWMKKPYINIIDSLYPSWYGIIKYPSQIDKLHLFETSVLSNKELHWDIRGQSLWKSHLREMKKKLGITNIKNNTIFTLPKGTILYHTANRVLPFHNYDHFESSYQYPAYFFGLSSLISLWYSVEKYTEYKRFKEKNQLEQIYLSKLKNSRESPPYYLNIYELTEDLRVLYLIDDIGLNQESSVGVKCYNGIPCLHPQYAYHSIEQLYSKRGPVELDFELTIPNHILEKGFLSRRRYSKNNPFGSLGPTLYQPSIVKPLLVYEIDTKLLLKHSYHNINDFNPLKSIILNDPIWKL